MDEYFGAQGRLAAHLENFALRPQQLEMARAASACFAKGGFFVCEAPTGVGKTFAYLIPAVLSGLKVVVSTATKNLQEQIFRKDIPIVKQALNHDFRAEYMKGRNNYLCLYRLKRYQAEPRLNLGDQTELFDEVCEWAAATATGDKSELGKMPADCSFWNEICSATEYCLFRNCPHFDDCFISKQKRLADDADILVVNHHLFFADLILRSEYARVLPRYEAVVFDEAHHIEDVATQFFGTRISNFQILRLIGDIRRELVREDSALNKRLADALKNLDAAKDAFFDPFFAAGKTRIKAGEIPAVVSAALAGALRAASRMVSDAQSEAAATLADRAVALAQEVEFISEAADPAFVYWAEGTEHGAFIHASPLEVGDKLNERLYPKISTVIFTSATLAAAGNLNFFRSRLGLKANLPVGEKILSSPFDWEKQAALYIGGDVVTPDHEDFIAQICLEIEELTAITKGRAFVLFTSYRNMERAFLRLQNRLNYPVMMQGQAPHQTLLLQFVNQSPAVLLATASFWEGVDVKGPALSCVIIDKLPFAAPDEPIVAGRIEYLKARDLNPFMDYQVPMAILKLKQGLGRLIRGEADCGVMAVLDNRLLYRRYGSLFLESLPRCPVVTSLEKLKSLSVIKDRTD